MTLKDINSLKGSTPNIYQSDNNQNPFLFIVARNKNKILILYIFIWVFLLSSRAQERDNVRSLNLKLD